MNRETINPFMKSIIESELELSKKTDSDISSSKSQDYTTKGSLVLGDYKPTRTIEKTLIVKEEDYIKESSSNIKNYLIIAFIIICLLGFGIYWYDLLGYRTKTTLNKN